LVRGRFFTSSDNKDAHNVIINQALATLYWPKEDAIGKRITSDDKAAEKNWYTVGGGRWRHQRQAHQS
jgi:hypothetical protein